MKVIKYKINGEQSLNRTSAAANLLLITRRDVNKIMCCIYDEAGWIRCCLQPFVCQRCIIAIIGDGTYHLHRRNKLRAPLVDLKPAHNSFLRARKHVDREWMTKVNLDNWLLFSLGFSWKYRSTTLVWNNLNAKKTNLILSGTVKILFARMCRVSLCLRILWQAWRRAWKRNNPTGSFQWELFTFHTDVIHFVLLKTEWKNAPFVLELTTEPANQGLR